jgi:hypothetical protein
MPYGFDPTEVLVAKVVAFEYHDAFGQNFG